MKLRDIVLSGTVGVVAAVLRFLYVFFPLFNVVDVLVFGVAGYAIGRTRPANKWMSFLLLVLPVMLLIGFVLTILGPQRLGEGVGIGHLYGAVLIPVAAALGFLLSRRRTRQVTAV